MKPAYRPKRWPTLAQLRAPVPEVETVCEEAVVEPAPVEAPVIASMSWEEAFCQGHAQGHAEGVEEGHVLAEEKLREGLAALGEPLQQWLQGLDGLQQDFMIAFGNQLLELAEQLARRVILHELEHAPQHMLAWVDEALRGLPAPDDAPRVRVHPEHYQRLCALDPAADVSYALEPDAQLALGECRVSVSGRELDLGCEHRLQAYLAQWQQSRPA